MFRYFFKNIAIVLSLTSVVHAADILPSRQNKQELDRLERQNNQQQIEEAKRNEQRLQQQREASEKVDEQSLTSTSGYRFMVKNIIIDDDNIFENSPQREEIIERYEGKELGQEEIICAGKRVNGFLYFPWLFLDPVKYSPRKFKKR